MALWPFTKKRQQAAPPAAGTVGTEDLLRYLSQPLAADDPAAAKRPEPKALDSFTSDAAMAQVFTAAPAPKSAARPATRAEAGGASSAAGLLEADLATAYGQHNGTHFLAPNDLAVSDIKLKRIAMIGSCFLGSLNLDKVNPGNVPVDLYLANNVASLDKYPETQDGQAPYDLQIVQMGLRFVLPDASFWRMAYTDTAACQAVLDRATRQLDFQLKLRMGWNIEHGLLTFVMNFLSPQRNPMGVLFPRFDLRNPEFFVQKLNEHLERTVATYKNAYILDMDRISASIGRRHCQDDVCVPISHNSLIGLRGEITGRIEPMPRTIEHFHVRWPKEFPGAVWNEMMAMLRTLRQVDSVKMVVVDLDDTLWTGVIGELTEVDADILDGWHIGLAEALMWLKKRGILLAIISKNDESRIRDLWPSIFGKNIHLDDFAAIKINWQPKAENMRQILEGVNLLPRSVVFVDDNPAERSAMRQAFPDMRILGRHPYYIRQTLLWAPETQVASVTEESSRRTEMIQAQLEREQHRQAYSAADFLAAAAPVVTLKQIDSPNHARFPRAQELVNKTNQFNTTGRRWAAHDWANFFGRGGQMHAFEVKDSYTSYGLVGVVLTNNGVIEQWVMSCRVLGYQIEDAVMALLVKAMRNAGATQISGRLTETDANFPCRGLFSKNGFVKAGSFWVLATDKALSVPGHITVTV